MRLTFGTAPLSPLELLEIVLTLLCLVLAFVRPSLGGVFFGRMERILKSLASRQTFCAFIVFLFPITGRLLLLPVDGPPTPFIHDEYAYLLQADTFASGRLTNPPPPLSRHFASIYVLMQPTYTAEYQPAQAATLAAGQALTKIPWVGIVACSGLFFAIFYWALLAWLSPVWAFAGTLLIEISIGILGYWTNSYWGGYVPGIGGALVLGSLPRLRSNLRPMHSVTLMVGLAILFESRPLEGALLALLSAGVFLYWLLITKEVSVRSVLAKFVVPAAVCFAPVLLFAGYYNTRVTGSPTKFPYLLYRDQYGLPQSFFWQKPEALKDANTLPLDIRAEYDMQIRMHERRRSAKGLALATAGKIRSFWIFYVGVPLTVPLLFVPFVWKERNRGLAAWALLLVVGFGNMTFFAYFPHYSAAVAVVIYVVLLDCLRRMRNSGARGLFLSRALPAVCVIGLLVPYCGRFIQPFVPPGFAQLWSSEFENWTSREQLVPALQAQPGDQLVLVRYNPRRHQDDDAWVYNKADIEHAKIVWARELDPVSNHELIQHFAGRTVWLGEPDARPPRLSLYRFLLVPER